MANLSATNAKSTSLNELTTAESATRTNKKLGIFETISQFWSI